MINPIQFFKRKAVHTEPELTELPYEYQVEAKSYVSPGSYTSYEFTNADGSSSTKTVRIVSVDYSRNRVTLEYLHKRNWAWIDVPIYDNFPML